MDTPSLADEMHLATMLSARGIKCDAFDGLTTHDQREEVFRKTILEHGPSLPAGRHHDMEVTFGQLFQLAYRKPL